MRKIGIDLGSASIGWVITEDGNMLKKGVVRFNTGMKKGTSGYVSPTRERREARSKRNLIRARKYRKWELLKILVNGGFAPLTKSELEIWSKYKKGHPSKFPENEAFLKWLACDFIYQSGLKYKNPYELRVKAFEHQLSKHEFGRVLYHLVQRRGYKDIGENDEETVKQKDRRKGENGFEQALEKNGGIISKALLEEFLNKNKRARNQYPYRDEYRYELEEICKAQGYNVSKTQKGDYTKEFVQKLWKAIIWQRDLKSQKSNIGKCTLEPKKMRCAISHPVFEIFRTWIFINTIKYYDENDEIQLIPKDIKNELFEYFLKKDRIFKFEEIRVFLDKQLKSYRRYNYPINQNVNNMKEIYTDGVYETSVSGMPICKGLIDVFGDKVREELDKIEYQNITQKDKSGGFGNAPKVVSNYSIIDLWHILFAFDGKSAKEKDFLSTFAKEKLYLTDENQIARFVKLKDKFQQGYSDLSVKAMCKIIPFLKDGYLYNEAVVLAKIPEILGDNWEYTKNEILTKAKEANNDYEWNKIIVGITNKLIEKFKGLKDDEIFAYNDFQYTLDDNGDHKDVLEAIRGYFGEKIWDSRRDNSKIIKEVKHEFQEFFHDQKRSYRRIPTLSDIFNEKLREQNIIIDTNKLYHHSKTENIYLKNCKIDKETERPILPQAKNKSGIEVDVLPGVQIDSIKNPMFNKSMSILRKLINELIKDEIIDNETEVVIEIARELNDNNKRIAIERYQKERENNREKYREFLTEFKSQNEISLNIEESIPTFELWTEQIFDQIDQNNKINIIDRHDIIKETNALKRYELWMEQKGQCIYTGKMISLSDLFSNTIDIEHTIPRSVLPDNTRANQTVCYARYNRDKKKNQIPTQCANFYKDAEGWGTRIEPRLRTWIEIRDDYKYKYNKNLRPFGNEDEGKKNKRIQDKHYNKLHLDYWKDKIERFEAEEIKDSWARRQLVDTQMVSKYAREFLKTYFFKVAVQKGAVTATFRKLYGFQDIEEVKNRNKHTHHAIDALVLTLIPTNSSYRERILKEYFKANENNDKETIKKIKKNEIPKNFNIQKLINEIENTTLIYNYEKDTLIKQTSKNIRKRGKKQYLKDKTGNLTLDENGNKIILKSQGDTVRSNLYAQTYLGKIKEVERDEFEKEIRFEKLNLNLKIKGLAKREGNTWKFKTGKDEFSFVKRESIDKVKATDSLISSIVDPVIRELVKKQRANFEVKDYQGNVIRHVRIRTNAGREVKTRLNYLSNHNYKNVFYSEAGAGSILYAILLQKFNKEKIERELISIPSFEISKMYKTEGQYDITKIVETSHRQYIDWKKDLLKVGQRVFVLQKDVEFEKRNNIDFQRNRLYTIRKFGENSIWLEYHLNAVSENEVVKDIDHRKDKLLSKYESDNNIEPVLEDDSILDNKARKDDFEKRKYSFNPITNSFRLNRLSKIIGLDETKNIKNELDKYKVRPATIEVEGETNFLKMSRKNWNFLLEGKDFKMKMDGTIKFNSDFDKQIL